MSQKCRGPRWSWWRTSITRWASSRFGCFPLWCSKRLMATSIATGDRECTDAVAFSSSVGRWCHAWFSWTPKNTSSGREAKWSYSFGVPPSFTKSTRLATGSKFTAMQSWQAVLGKTEVTSWRSGRSLAYRILATFLYYAEDTWRVYLCSWFVSTYMSFTGDDRSHGSGPYESAGEYSKRSSGIYCCTPQQCAGTHASQLCHFGTREQLFSDAISRLFEESIQEREPRSCSGYAIFGVVLRH